MVVALKLAAVAVSPERVCSAAEEIVKEVLLVIEATVAPAGRPGPPMRVIPASKPVVLVTLTVVLPTVVEREVRLKLPEGSKMTGALIVGVP